MSGSTLRVNSTLTGHIIICTDSRITERRSNRRVEKII